MHLTSETTTRRRLLTSAAAIMGGSIPVLASSGCGSDENGRSIEGSSEEPSMERSARFFMPAEDTVHERTWMCWPSSEDIWGDDLVSVQDTILLIANAIARFEPVTLLARPDQVGALSERVDGAVTIEEGPVDDLWARDTLPCFLIGEADDANKLAAGVVRFNGWGNKQEHAGDSQLAALVAELVGVDVIDSGLIGEGGGLEVDGEGTVLAAASSWVNENRNPGMSRDSIETELLELLGADRMLWIDGLAGQDITDGHIDTLARFVDAETILVDVPAFDDPDDPWVGVAADTKATIETQTTADGAPYTVTTVTQPKTTRMSGDSFLSTYMNFYVCNGAVMMPEFGDPESDEAARSVLASLYPDREIVMLNIDPIAAGGGGIHCATQQQPKVS